MWPEDLPATALIRTQQRIAGAGPSPLRGEDGGMARERPSRAPGRAVCIRSTIHHASVARTHVRLPVFASPPWFLPTTVQ